LENRRSPSLRDKPNGAIKWRKAGLENLLVNHCLKRRIKRRPIRGYWIGEYQNPPYPFKVSPTNVHTKIVLEVNDFGTKASV
jgi:hypothetical protein